MALAETSSFRIIALQLFGSRREQMNVLSFISLLGLVDGKTLPVTTAVELSYLIEEDQRRVLESGVISSLAQAKQLRKEFFELTPTQKSVSFSLKTFRPYFPKEYTTEQIIEGIIKLLEAESK